MTCSYPTHKILHELIKASNAFLQTSDFKQATRTVYDCCKKIIGSTAGYVALLSADKSENELLFLDMSGMQCSLNPNQPMPIRGLRAEAYSSGETVYDNNFPQSEWLQYLPEGHGRLDNVLFAPLIIDNEAVGVFGFANRPGGFCEDSALIARTFAEIAAIGLLQNKTVNRLETTAKHLSALMEAAHDAIITVDGHGDIFSWNNAAENIFGYSSDEMIGNSCMRIIPDQYKKRHKEALAKVSETGISKLAAREIVIEARHKNNEMFPAELSLSKWNFDGAVFFTGIIRDISLRKKMEQETMEAESRLRKVFEHMKGGGAIYKAIDDGEDFIIIDFHRPELQGLNKKNEDMRGKKILEVFPASKEYGLFEVFQRVWKTGKPEIHPVKIFNDKEITGWRENYVYKLPTGEIVALYEDFTERKKMEVALQTSESLFRTIFESSPNSININRLEDGRFVKVNNKFLELTGFEKNEVIGKTALDINVWKSLAKRKEFFSLLYEKGQVENFGADFMCKDGSTINTQVSAELITYKNKPHLIAVTQNISDLKKAEQDLQEAHIQLKKKFTLRTEELKESQINYRMIADYTYDWEWWERPDGTFRYVSPACERITGYKADLFIKDHSFLREIIVPEDWDKWDKHLHESHKGSGLREMQFRIKRVDGVVRWIEHACQPVFTEGNVFLGFRASNRDITARKQAEQKLQKTERQSRDLIDNSLVGVFSSRYSTGEFVFVNNAMARIYDFESSEQMIAQKAVAGWKDPPKREQMLATITKHGSVNNWNAEIITRAGHQRHVLFSAKLEDGIISGMVMDITKRVLAEAALQASEVSLNKAQEVAHIGSWYLDLVENNLVWTDENYRIFGIPKGSPLTYQKFLEIVHPEDRDYVDDKWHATIKGEPYDIEHRLLVDNEVKWVKEKAELNYDHNGKPTSGVGITQDITEHKLAEEALSESRKRLIKAEQIARMGFLDWNIKTNEIELSREVFDLYGIDPGMPITLEQIMELVHPDERKFVEENLDSAIKGFCDYNIDHRIVRPDGEVLWVHARADIELDGEGRPYSMIGTVVDITERKLAEEEKLKTNEELRTLSAQLMTTEERERKRIAGDIHDTIGQALSAIKFSVENSLFTINKKDFSAAVRSLESIVPLTQQTIEEVRRIIMDLRPSILDDLGLIATISWLCREFESIYNHIHIDKEIHLEEADIPLSLKSVIYRILQEALNNAAKHSQTEIIRFHLMKNGDSLELLFEDSGLGFDSDTVQSKVAGRKGMGLGSMKERAQMSGGTFTIKSSPGIGTRIHISWPINLSGIDQDELLHI